VLRQDTKVSDLHAASDFKVRRWYPTTTPDGVTMHKTST